MQSQCRVARELLQFACPVPVGKGKTLQMSLDGQKLLALSTITCYNGCILGMSRLSCGLNLTTRGVVSAVAPRDGTRLDLSYGEVRELL